MGALMRVWRGSVALITWAVKLVRSSHSNALPRSVSRSSTRGKSIWNFLAATSRRARRQSHAALELLRKFRHGPENHSEWNLFLWRATFPLISLILLTLLCIVGHFGHTAYSLIVNPVWYLCNFVLVTMPFLLVFRFSGLNDVLNTESQSTIWYGLATVSGAISLVEWYMSLPASRYSWIVGNTLFGIVALGAIPLFFSIQSRTSRSQYEALIRHEQEQDELRPVPEEKEDASSDRETKKGIASQKLAEDSKEARKGKENKIQGQRKHVMMTRLLYGCGFSALVLWLVMFCSYSSAQGGEAVTSLWFLLYSLSPVLFVVLFCSRKVQVRFSFEHAVAYSTLVVHLPLFFGHFCVRLFTLTEDSTATSPTHVESWLKLAVSVLYLLLMQGYFFVITYMVNSMSEPFAHPSLLYVGQLYYYVYWYILVGTDTPIDGLYWAMLLLNNIHIAFLNTGVYTDFKRVSTVWLTTPLHVNLSSSVAVCLRTTTSAMATSRCRPQRKAFNGESLLGFSCGVAGAAVVETQSELLDVQNEEYDFNPLDGLDGETRLQHIDDKGPSVSTNQLPSWEETENRNWERDYYLTNRASTDAHSPTHKGKTNLMFFGEKCSLAQRNCRECGKSSQSGVVTMASGPSTSNVDFRTATSNSLKPLYFLMKLAEQDNMADTTALILVPSLLTLLAVFEKPGSALTVLQDQANLWLRCVCMFIGRLGGSFLAREIFTCKLRTRLRSSLEDFGDVTQSDPISGCIDGVPARLWIQRLMLHDFHAQFGYLTAVTVVVTFGCFARIDLPLRFALL
ncbi:hypothetical protein Plhal304r1_c006g0024621 [Plasmopara halstedii]